MSPAGRESFEKRNREKRRQERQAAKRDRRHSRGDGEDDTEEAGAAPDESALMEQYRVLSERHASGVIDDRAFESGRHEIFVALGLEAQSDVD